MATPGTLGNSATPPTIEYEGKVYSVRALDFVMLTDFGARLLAQEAQVFLVSDMEALRVGLLTKAEVVERKDAFVREARQQKRYSLGSPEFFAIINDLQAMTVTLQTDKLTQEQMLERFGKFFEPIMILASLMLGCDMDAAVKLFFAKGSELMDALSLVLGASFSDPKAQAATAV